MKVFFSLLLVVALLSGCSENPANLEPAATLTVIDSGSINVNRGRFWDSDTSYYLNTWKVKIDDLTQSSWEASPTSNSNNNWERAAFFHFAEPTKSIPLSISGYFPAGWPVEMSVYGLVNIQNLPQVMDSTVELSRYNQYNDLPTPFVISGLDLAEIDSKVSIEPLTANDSTSMEVTITLPKAAEGILVRIRGGGFLRATWEVKIP